uniref:BTB domain-containing protein n=1 Tax=Rhizophagus irregularis (strain DAOM 181602 / DAOM 197198 / MUCL 43194) TaxID=747089 RepID=U9SVS1_RHIID
MVFLHYRSTYLRRILSTNKKKNDGTLVHIKLPNILPEIFQIILRYIYSGRISLGEYDTLDIIKILVAGSELGLQELITYLQSFLIKTKANWMEQNFNLIYQTSFENDSFLELQQFCTNLITKKPNKIFKSPSFSSTPEKLLVSLIQSDNLQMNEIQVWEHVLKWGLAQSPELPSDPTNFSKEDFKTLKNNMRQCIPLIRFHNLSSEEFSNKVLPYRKILPKDLLYEDLLKYFMNPNNQSIGESKPRMTTKEINIDSKIITPLLLRDSHDGFTDDDENFVYPVKGYDDDAFIYQPEINDLKDNADDDTVFVYTENSSKEEQLNSKNLQDDNDEGEGTSFVYPGNDINSSDNNNNTNINKNEVPKVDKPSGTIMVKLTERGLIYIR